MPWSARPERSNMQPVTSPYTFLSRVAQETKMAGVRQNCHIHDGVKFTVTVNTRSVTSHIHVDLSYLELITCISTLLQLADPCYPTERNIYIRMPSSSYHLLHARSILSDPVRSDHPSRTASLHACSSHMLLARLLVYDACY